MKEVYVANDIPEGKTINDIIKQKKMTKKFQKENILDKTAFKTEFVAIFLPSLAKKGSKKDLQLLFNVFSCVCKEEKQLAIADFLSYAADFKSSPKDEGAMRMRVKQRICRVKKRLLLQNLPLYLMS